MMERREKIFAAIRKTLGPEPGDPSDIVAALDTLVAHPSEIQPAFDQGKLEERFIEKATSERVTATISRVASPEGVPDAVRAYLADTGLEPNLALQPTERLTSLDWTGFDTQSDLVPDQPVAVSLVEFGIAETGSVVFRSGADAPVLFNFLPLHHIVVLDRRNILPHLEDLWDRIAKADDPQPRSLNIITGTSGTADIEAKNVRGAHGPRFMRIILVN